jgi:phosphatidylinositol alpha-mannosyltransferase
MFGRPHRSLRIGLVCPYSLTIPGGVQGQVMGLARELRAMGHEARVLGPCDGAPPATFVTPLGNSLPTATNGSIAPLAPDVPAALRTIRALRDEDFDVVHLHEPAAPGPSMTAMLVKSAPAVATVHRAGDSSIYRLMQGALAWGGQRIDRWVAVSKDAADLAERYFGRECAVLFNGVELDRYRPSGRHLAGREEVPTIFFCGRHEPRKGLDVLLRALAGVPAEVRCWVASDGPETERLQREHAGDPRVEWLGRLSDAEKIDRLQRASLFCAPSLHGESFGVVLIEAMAAGTPVVASALDGYRNVATSGVDAELVEPGDVAALTAALNRVLFEPEVAELLRRAGEQRATEFSMRTLAQRYLEIYEEIVDDPVAAESVIRAGSMPAWPIELGESTDGGVRGRTLRAARRVGARRG